MTAADNSLEYFFIVFSDKIMLDISCESSAWIHMKNQAVFSLKDKSKKLKCHLLQFWFGTLRVKVWLRREAKIPNAQRFSLGTGHALLCLSSSSIVGTPKNINFPFVLNGKLMFLGVLLLKHNWVFQNCLL